MIERARQILSREAEAIQAIPLGESFQEAVGALLSCKGKIITAGIGKAGYIARKAASTLCTTGTPSTFLHPGDASHGDVGIIAEGDILIAFSNSGKTREVLETVTFCRSLGVSQVIAVTAHPESPLAKASEIVLEIGHVVEACPLGLTPTASTAAMHALCDALALITMEERKFTAEAFSLRHHGGYLGEKLRGEG